MKLALAAFALTILVLFSAQSALADEVIVKQECNLPFPFSLFEETSKGENCPASATEKGVGQIIVGVTAFAIGAEVISGGEVFPINSGIFSGVASGL